jgi:Type VI secretion system/phage-baseplate injector OB domain
MTATTEEQEGRTRGTTSSNDNYSIDGSLYGKYRGKVTKNDDPSNLGRIRALVPDVFDDEESPWALPCTPYAGNKVGFFFIPPVDANVWIEFEKGQRDSPIWSGCFWADGELDKDKAVPNIKMIKTDFATITIDDSSTTSQQFSIETTSGLKIVMDSYEIELSNGSSIVKLSPVSVSINDGALQVI